MRTEYRVIALSAILLAGISGFARAADTRTTPAGLANLSSHERAELFASRAAVNPSSRAARLVPRPAPRVDVVQRPLSGPVTTNRPQQSCDNIACGSYSQIGINF